MLLLNTQSNLVVREVQRLLRGKSYPALEKVILSSCPLTILTVSEKLWVRWKSFRCVIMS